jgi:hypothetical protein
VTFFDRTIGAGATRGEIELSVAGAVVGAVMAGVLAWHAQMAPMTVAVVVAIALDGFGGAVVNATASNKRWFHRPGRTDRFHLLYVAAHVHPFALALVVPGFTWAAAAGVYASVLAPALVIAAVPLPLRRPTAFLFAAVSTAVVTSVITIPHALSWFAPVLIIQLLLSHMLSEETPS